MNFFPKTVITAEIAEESIAVFNDMVGNVTNRLLSDEEQVAVLESVRRIFMSLVNLSSSGEFNISEDVSFYAI